MANLSSKPSSYPPPEGLLWGESEPNPARRALEPAPELKGVFGAGASNVTRPKAAVSAGTPRDVLEQPLPLDNEQRRARARAARAHGLWNNAARDPSESVPNTQPKLGTLPRAVLGNVSATAANDAPQVGRHATRGMHADTTIVSANMGGPRLIPAQWLAEAQTASAQAANQNADVASEPAPTPLPSSPELSFATPAPDSMPAPMPTAAASEPRGRAAVSDEAAFEPDELADGGEKPPFQVPDLPRPESRARTFEPAAFDEAPSVFPPARPVAAQAQAAEASGARAVGRDEHARSPQREEARSARENAGDDARSLARDEQRSGRRDDVREAEPRETQPATRTPRPQGEREPTGRREVTGTAEAQVREKVAERVRASQRPKSRAPRVLGVALLCAVLLAAAAVGGVWAGWWQLPGLTGLLVGKGKAAKSGHEQLETQTAPSLNAPTAHQANEAKQQPQPTPATPQVEAPAMQPEKSAAPAGPGTESPQQPQTKTGDATGASTESAATDSASDSQGDLYAQQQEARRLLREKQPKAAETLLLRALKQAPGDLTSTTLLTQAYIAQHHGPEAQESAEKLVEKRPKRAVFHVLLGDARRLSGDRAGAIESFRTALKLDPGSREAKQRLAHFGADATTPPSE